MLLVFTGNSTASTLKPKYAPKKTNGVETPNHINNNSTILLNGTASLLSFDKANIFITKKRANVIVGNPNAVTKVALCQFFPLNVLYKRAVTYPATLPIKM
eukprot:247479_1